MNGIVDEHVLKVFESLQINASNTKEKSTATTGSKLSQTLHFAMVAKDPICIRASVALCVPYNHHIS